MGFLVSARAVTASALIVITCLGCGRSNVPSEDGNDCVHVAGDFTLVEYRCDDTELPSFPAATLSVSDDCSGFATIPLGGGCDKGEQIQIALEGNTFTYVLSDFTCTAPCAASQCQAGAPPVTTSATYTVDSTSLVLAETIFQAAVDEGRTPCAVGEAEVQTYERSY